jgi:hypothetical protein
MTLTCETNDEHQTRSYQNAFRYSVIIKLSKLEKQMTNNNMGIGQRCRHCLAQNGAHTG